MALKRDGTVWTWGFNSSGQLGDQSETDRNKPAIVPGIANVIAIAAGDYHTVALKMMALSGHGVTILLDSWVMAPPL
ncbi:MAG: hypothetical protein OMM_15190 [Candidatus Magnetoglobus multicellularis str. Araruama]|uniref:Uncharacterized protein n=1 Tax=Candidatus Magnetoglobus multicellularis str. Araruama TaxID=890399 RepID=A0A1V1NQQ1_9BACT|nr:MAG: hypothetical protein OMM_15190 [Candidatus Magnetoglobus multicellularis str. Araruama]